MKFLLEIPVINYAFEIDADNMRSAVTRARVHVRSLQNYHDGSNQINLPLSTQFDVWEKNGDKSQLMTAKVSYVNE